MKNQSQSGGAGPVGENLSGWAPKRMVNPPTDAFQKSREELTVWEMFNSLSALRHKYGRIRAAPASGVVLVGSRSAAARRLLRPRQPSARDHSRCAVFTTETTKADPDDLDWGVVHAVGWPEREIWAIAAAQQSIITRIQLLELGVGRGAIEHALARGRLHRLHRGVYALVPPAALPTLAAERAAVLACGPDALVSHHSAAAVWGIRPRAHGGIDVTIIGRDSGRDREGICAHRIAHLDQRDARRHRGIPITSPARTLVDIAPRLSERSFERAFDEALIRGLITLGSMDAVLGRYPKRTGAARIRALARPDRATTATRSEGEERFLALVRRGRLPEPEVNARLGRFVADFLWRRERVLVEVDGYDYHRGRAAFERDHERDAEHQREGFLVIRTTWRQLEREPEALLVRVATALARRRAAA